MAQKSHHVCIILFLLLQPTIIYIATHSCSREEHPCPASPKPLTLPYPPCPAIPPRIIENTVSRLRNATDVSSPPKNLEDPKALERTIAHEQQFSRAVETAYRTSRWSPTKPLVLAHLVNWFHDFLPDVPGIQWSQPTRQVPLGGYYDMTSLAWLHNASDMAKHALISAFAVSWLPEGHPIPIDLPNGTHVHETVARFMDPLHQYASEPGNTPIVALFETLIMLPAMDCIIGGWNVVVQKPKGFSEALPAHLRCGDVYLNALKDLVKWFYLPSYHRVPAGPDGLPRPVVLLYLARQAHNSAQYLKEFRIYARSKGFNPYIIGDVVWWNPSVIETGYGFWRDLSSVVDCFTGYNPYDGELGATMGDVPYIENRQFQLNVHFFAAAKHFGLDFMPSVAPGYDDTLFRGSDRAVMPRDAGIMYQTEWAMASAFTARSKADALPWVFLRSFNEWVEGTQIEPSTEDGGFFLEETRRQVLQAAVLLSDASPPIFR